VVKKLGIAAAAALSVMLLAGTASAATCAGSGVITRIQGGTPNDVAITRSGSAVTKPRVLEVVCAGDVVSAKGAAVITLSIDGVGAVRVDKAKPYTVGPRRGRPGAAGNVYRAVSDQVMPDMKRLPWDARIKAMGDPLHFTVPDSQPQTITSRTSLSVRMVGPEGQITVQLLDPSGATVKTVQTNTGEVTLSGLSLGAGVYTIKASNGSENAEMKFTVSADRPAPSADIAELSDPEVQAALYALELAKADPNKWSFEAQQIIAAAPANGLDRERVLQLMETYGDL
jgi:hypothetical protein